MTTVVVGPEVLGIEIDARARTSDGWVERDLALPGDLDGPRGILQGGFAVGTLIAAARAEDGYDAPVTSVDARLRAPTPLGRTVTTRVRPAEGTARYEVETRSGDRVLVRGKVELAGHEVSSHAADLVELARVALPEPEPQPGYPDCWVCGYAPRHAHALHVFPGWHEPGTVVSGWVAEDVLADAAGRIDPLVVSAALDCPTAWVCRHVCEEQGMAGPLLGGYHVRFLGDAPVTEPLRTVARIDGVDGRKVRARSALVDADGVVYAVASALQVLVAEIPTLDVPPRQ